MFIYSSTSLYISFSYTSIPCSVTVVLLFFTVSPPKIEIKKDDKTRSQIHSGTFLNPFLLSDLLGFNRLK
nr:MAG TPA: hypothetical protein [Caudoviricetes sp.]DAT24133.1 MAG TPA: hypothetical protein [Caudoviricetes sp.]